MEVQTVIFDLGNVLIDWNPRHLFKKLFTDAEEMEYFLREVCTMDWNEQQDAGRTWEEATSILIEKFPDYAPQIKAYHHRWSEMLNGEIPGTKDILKTIRQDARYRLYALTNWSSETFPIALDQFEFLQWFEGIVVSGDEKLKKPDSKIYQLILDRYDIDPSTAIFIDDSLRNVDAANQMGIHAIHFKDAVQLGSELKELRVL